MAGLAGAFADISADGGRFVFQLPVAAITSNRSCGSGCVTIDQMVESIPGHEGNCGPTVSS